MFEMGLLVVGTIGMAVFFLIFAVQAGRVYPSRVRLPAVVAAAGITMSSVFQGLYELELIPRTPAYDTLTVLPLMIGCAGALMVFRIVRAGPEQSKDQKLNG